MQYFAFLYLYGLLLTLVKSNAINEEIHSEASNSKHWPTNRIFTWKLNDDHSLYDSRKVHRDIERASNDWARHTELNFREVTEDEKTDFNLTFVSGESGDHSDTNDHDSIMSPFYRLVQLNEILTKQNQDSIQALYGKKKNPVTSLRPNRRVRSITTTQTKAKKIQRATRKKIKKIKKKPKNNYPKDFKIGDERQLVRFKADEKAKITKMIKKLKPDNTLIAFKDLSTIINKAIGMLPTKVIPILQTLGVSYSTTRTTIEIGFTSSSVILSEFVIKSWQVIENGMNKKAQKALVTVGNQLYTIFIDELHAFVGSSRAELVQIQSQLLLEATGGRAQNLLDKRNILETDLLQLSASLKNKASECGDNQKIIDSLQLAALLTKTSSAIHKNPTPADVLQSVNCGSVNELEISSFRVEFGPGEANETPKCDINQGITDSTEHETELFIEFTGDLQAAKDELIEVIVKLKEQIHVYKNKIQGHHDRRLEERALFWIFAWKVRDVYAGNDEKIIQENIDRLIERTNFLQDILQDRSIVDLVKGLLDGKEPLPLYKAKQIQLEQERKKLKERHDQVSKEFYAVIEQLDEIYRSTGTNNVESMKMVDELCRAIQSGQDSITSAYTIMRINLSAISVDSDLLVASVFDVLQVLNMIDRYLDTTKIEDLKQVLALK